MEIDELFNKFKTELPNERLTERISEVFKIFGDNTRIRILWLLFNGELCVLDISERVSMTPSAVSHQLKTLKQARLIKSRRVGRQTFYSLDDEHVKKIIEQVLIHVAEDTSLLQP